MAKLEFKAAVDVKATPERAFDYVADYRHVREVLDGVTVWQPIGATSRGTGARFKVEMVTFGVPLRNVLRLNRWQSPGEIGWVSESGLIRQDGGFTFQKIDGGVRIGLRIAYEPPAAAIGAAVAHRFDSLVRRRLDHAMERIRETLES